MDQIRSFVTSAFPSVWALELLLLLSEEPERSFTREELVATLRASDVVVGKSGDALLAAGLVVEEGTGRLRYGAASADLHALVERTRAMYRSRPDAVRRLIVAGASGIDAFAEAFRLRRDNE